MPLYLPPRWKNVLNPVRMISLVLALSFALQAYHEHWAWGLPAFYFLYRGLRKRPCPQESGCQQDN